MAAVIAAVAFSRGRSVQRLAHGMSGWVDYIENSLLLAGADTSIRLGPIGTPCGESADNLLFLFLTGRHVVRPRFEIFLPHSMKGEGMCSRVECPRQLRPPGINLPQYIHPAGVRSRQRVFSFIGNDATSRPSTSPATDSLPFRKACTNFEVQVSCSLCRRKKLRCSRDQPCSNCVARQVTCERDAPLPGRKASASPITNDPCDATSTKNDGNDESALSARLQRVEALLLRLDAKINDSPLMVVSRSQSQHAASTPYSVSQYMPNATEVAHRDDTRELDGVGATDADLVSHAFPLGCFARCTAVRSCETSRTCCFPS
jgi:hypothetical protein